MSLSTDVAKCEVDNLRRCRISQQQMNERNFHIFYRMLAPGRAVEKHKDSKGGEKTEEVVTENMTTTEGECLLFDEVLLTAWFSGSYQSSHMSSCCSPALTKLVVASDREGRE